jgi:hypothetical protein
MKYPDMDALRKSILESRRSKLIGAREACLVI